MDYEEKTLEYSTITMEMQMEQLIKINESLLNLRQVKRLLFNKGEETVSEQTNNIKTKQEEIPHPRKSCCFANTMQTAGHPVKCNKEAFGEAAAKNPASTAKPISSRYYHQIVLRWRRW